MTLMGIIKQAERFTADNSPLILTAIGVAGTVATAVLTGKATIKAAKIVNVHRYDQDPNAEVFITKKEIVERTWKLYIPPVTVGALTVVSIIGANRIGTRRAAAMAAAYAVSERAFSEYKEQVVKKLGEVKERTIRDDLAQDQVNRSPVAERQVIIAGGNVLCYEPRTDRYFHSDMESLKKAMNDLNYKINNNYYASLSEFYDLIGLPHTEESDELGWNSDELLDLDFSTVLATDGRPAISMSYVVKPIRKYYRVQ
jgi:hypothetical protein